MWFAWLYLLGPPELASQYSCVITVRNKSGSRCMTYQGGVHSVDKDVKSVLNTADCLTFTDGMVKNIVQGYPNEQKDEEEMDELKYLLAMQYEVRHLAGKKSQKKEL